MTPNLSDIVRGNAIDLPASSKKEVVDYLARCVGEMLALSLICRQAHWNVKGPNFGPLHGLFGDVYEAAAGWSDTLAERAVQLGGAVNATPASFAPQTKNNERGWLAIVAKGLATVANNLRGDIDECLDAKDQVTANLLADMAGQADKWLWKVESHLKD